MIHREPLDSNLDAELAVALTSVARVLARLLRAELKAPSSPDAWVSQGDSPLGRSRHCRLVRQGELPGRKVGRQLLVRAADIDAYIERHPVEPQRPRTPLPSGDEIDRELESLGFGVAAVPKPAGRAR